MKQSLITRVEQIFYPGWLMTSQLRSGQEITDGVRLYRRAKEVVTQAREQLTEAGVSRGSADSMVYALCALLDESVMNRGRNDDAYLTWQKDPLQAHFFGTLNAGEELWDRIREQLRSPSPDVAVLMCLYRTLQLGFSGQYRTEDDERREEALQALAERAPAFSLSSHQPLVVGSSVKRGGRWLYWFSWGLGITTLAALWLTFYFVLAAQVAKIGGPG